MLCTGVILMSFSLAELLLPGIRPVQPDLREAQFDRLLLRPRSLIFQLICQESSLLGGESCCRAR